MSVVARSPARARSGREKRSTISRDYAAQACCAPWRAKAASLKAIRWAAIGAVVMVVLADCGNARHSVARSKPPVSAATPPPFGSGEDSKRATKLANAIFHRRLKERYSSHRFLLETEAVSWTRTHLLVQFDGRVLHNPVVKNVEIRVLIALGPNHALKLSELREHTLRHLSSGEEP